MKVSLIIAAGGQGSRFKKSQSRLAKIKESNKVSKLFFDLCGQAVLVHTLRAFKDISEISEIILAVPSGDVSAVQSQLEGYTDHPLKVVAGGATRSESVYKGLQQAYSKNEWIMVHDGARPFVRPADIKRLLREVKGCEGALLASPMVSTVKQVKQGTTQIEKTVDRQNLYVAETPQLVKRKVFEKAYKENKKALKQTDDVGLLETLSVKVKVVSHNHWNPKITTMKDLELARAYLGQNVQVVTRVGLGQDTHRLVRGRPFYLGGLLLENDRGPLGHSDGDVLLHSIIDGILGAMGEGDIGDWFSDKNAAYKNMRSTEFLRVILEKVKKEKWMIEHVDSVITLQRPKLGILKNELKENLSRLLDLQLDQVSVKAKTAEYLGPEGLGQAISCQSIVTMYKK